MSEKSERVLARFLKYRLRDGAALGVYSCPATAKLPETPGIGFMPMDAEVTPSEVRVDTSTGAVVPRQEVPFDVEYSEQLLAHIRVPAGAVAVFEDETAERVEDGVIELEVDEPGTYVIRVSHPLHLPTDIEVTL